MTSEDQIVLMHDAADECMSPGQRNLFDEIGRTDQDVYARLFRCVAKRTTPRSIMIDKAKTNKDIQVEEFEAWPDKASGASEEKASDQRAEFEVAYVSWLRSMDPDDQMTADYLRTLRDGDGYHQHYSSLLFAAWWGWQAGSNSAAENATVSTQETIYQVRCSPNDEWMDVGSEKAMYSYKFEEGYETRVIRVAAVMEGSESRPRHINRILDFVSSVAASAAQAKESSHG